MLSGTNSEKLLVASMIVTSIMADGCGTGQDLVIGGSSSTCDKIWTIQREYNENADITLCAARCAEHSDCTHFSLSEKGTCVTYRGCDTLRESGQVWDTYETQEPCETTTENGELVAPPAADVQVALNLVHELEGVLQDMEHDLDSNRRRNEVVCGDHTDKWECRRDGCLWTGKTCHDSSFEPECGDWERSGPCESDTRCNWDADTKTCFATETPTATPTEVPTAEVTEEQEAFALNAEDLADGVQNMAVQAGFRYKQCVEAAPFGGFAKIVLSQFAPSILGDLLNFETARRRWGFNKNNFITNIAEPLNGVSCEDVYGQCVSEATRVYQEGLAGNQADVASNYPFMSGNIDFFTTCAEEEIADICNDYKNLACPVSE